MKIFRTLSIFCFCLFSLMAEAQETKIEKEFQVRIYGDGKPILLFPGFSCSSEVYSTIIPKLSKSHQVHAFTFAGFGGVKAIEIPWLEKIKDGVMNYIDTYNLEEAVLIGHSMGGTLALWLSSERPNSFKELVVIDGLPAMGALMIPNYDSASITYDTPYNRRMIDMNADEFSSMAHQMAASMSSKAESQAQIQKWMEMADRKTYVYGYTDLLKLDLRNALSSIKIPVTILAASQPYGKQVTEKNYRDQYTHLGTYDLVFAENSKHFIMYDQPEWFESQIKKVLEVK